MLRPPSCVTAFPAYRRVINLAEAAAVLARISALPQNAKESQQAIAQPTYAHVTPVSFKSQAASDVTGSKRYVRIIDELGFTNSCECVI